MQNRKLTRWVTAGVAALALCAGSVGAGILTKNYGARAENAASGETPLLGKDGSATGALDGKKMQISPWGDGSYSYQFRGQQLEFKFAPAIDASWAQTKDATGFKVKDNVYLEFWIFSNRPQDELAWGGDRQIEIASRADSQHDYEEYHWNFSDIIFQRGDGGTKAYTPGVWNRARLKLTPEGGAGTESVDLGAIKYLRMYYLFNTVTYTDPVFISDMKLTTGTDTDPSVIREYKDPVEVQLPDELAMPQGKTEGDVVTLPMPVVKDLDGKTIPESKINVTTFGPNGYEMKGRTIELEDGNGTYTARYSLADMMGVIASKDYTFSVAKANTDLYAPKILAKANMPVDFMAGAGTYTVSDYISIVDNYGYDPLVINASIKDDAGVEIAAFAKVAGESKAWSLNFTPTKKVTYSLTVDATDASGKKTTKTFQLKTYLPAQTEREVNLFDGSDLELLKGNYYSGRFVDAVPKGGEGTTVSFHYKGGATDTSNNEAYRQEMILMNNSPADISSIDLRWAAIRFNIYVDVRYANDDQWMPSNGTGYGNMGIGFSSYSGIYGVPRMEYSINEMHLQAGWSEVTLKIGRVFNGTIDYNALCEMYLYTNFGAQRHMLINDIRMIETAEFPEGIPTASDMQTYVRVKHLSSANEIGAATVTLDESGIYQWNDNIYNANEIRFPGLIVTDAMGKSDVVETPNVRIVDPAGSVTESMFFKPDQEGTHTITYTSTDWYGKPVTLVKEFNVLPWNAMPVIKIETVINDIGDPVPKIYENRAGNTFTVPTLQITDAQGERVKVSYRVTAPDGKSVTLNANGKSFKTELPGNYIVTVIAEDEVGQIATAELTVRSYNVTKSIYQTSLAGLGWIIGGSAAGVVVLAVLAVVLVLVLKKRKKTESVNASVETEVQDDEDGVNKTDAK